MKSMKLLLALALLPSVASAQTDSTLLKGTFRNDEYHIYIKMDLYHNNIVVPGQEVFGEMAGFLGDYRDWRKWLFASAKIKKAGVADLEISNDYGSEDLTARLTVRPDGTATLKQGEGSTIKIARNRKWVKLPDEIVFKRVK